ncbi:MAG: L-carnitine dehydratase/bile acid-inducible protein [Frankiales bacterium]|jgi:CoA:oxalate CoA-transferase|nr:L-carnitine dehydratase/bile acid-inducible protein [Frankiales bacterium]
MSRVLAGPYACRVLAEMGADVVKAEFPDGDPARRVGPHVDGTSLYFASVNAGKRSVVVDPRAAGGADQLEALLRWADVVIHNFRPAAAESLGLTRAGLAARHPRLVVVTVSGFGSDTPAAGDPAYDLTIQAATGVMALTGIAGGDPVRAGVPLSDVAAGLWAALAAVSGLFASGRGDTPAHLEVPLFDATLSLLTYVGTVASFTGVEPARVGSGHQSLCPYDSYPASDGFVVIAVLDDKFWAPTCRALGLQDLLDQPDLASNPGRLARRHEVNAQVAAASRGLSVRVLADRLSAEGVPHAPVAGVLEAMATPYAASRRLLRRYPAADRAYAVLVGPLGGCELAPPPGLGEHTDEVLAEVARLTDQEGRANVAG